MCHPDRSIAEWRDLLFVWVSTHATASRLAREFRDRTHAMGKLDKRAIDRADTAAASVQMPQDLSSTPPQSFEGLPGFRAPSSYPRSQSDALPLPSRNPDKDDAVR